METLKQTWSVKTTKKALRQLCEAAESQGLPVEHRVKGSIDNIYINNQLVGHIDTETSIAIVVVEVNYSLADITN